MDVTDEVVEAPADDVDKLCPKLVSMRLMAARTAGPRTPRPYRDAACS